MSTSQDALREIANTAIVLEYSYPEQASEYTRSYRLYKETSDHGPAEYLADAKHGWREDCKLCEHWRGEVRRLGKLVILHMPDVARTLRLIDEVAERWYENADFDWQALVAELRLIRVEAINRATPEKYASSKHPAARSADAETASKRRIRERQRKAWDLHENGHTNSQIAGQLDCSEATVSRDLKAPKPA